MSKCSRRGSVLIPMLIMLSFLLSVALLLFDKSVQTYGGVTAVQADYQGDVYANTAIKALGELIRYDDASFDSREDLWLSIPSIPLERGSLAVIMTPIDDRIPINGLINADENIRNRVRTALETMFNENEIEWTLIDNITEWITPPSDNVSRAQTAYNTDGNGYLSKHAALDTLQELRLIPAVVPIYDRLQSVASTGSNQTPRININFASAEVIRAFLPELALYADEIVTARAEDPFKSKSRIFEIMRDSEAYSAILPFFDVKSSLFYVRIEVTFIDDVRNYHLMVERNGQTLTIRKYIEGGNLAYF